MEGMFNNECNLILEIIADKQRKKLKVNRIRLVHDSSIYHLVTIHWH
jgi:hypothetical protein